MAPKRKSDAMQAQPHDISEAVAAPLTEETALQPSNKKARVTEISSEPQPLPSSLKDKAQSWKDIKLDGEDEGEVPVYDDCGEVRRKIRLLQKTPNWKVTHWLKEIGGINNNSYGRFMREKGKTDGAANGTYYAAYVYFEKVRIFEGKKKSASRIRNEEMQPSGFPLEVQRGFYLFRKP